MLFMLDEIMCDLNHNFAIWQGYGSFCLWKSYGSKNKRIISYLIRDNPFICF